MLQRFPQLRQITETTRTMWPGWVFLRITPSIISLLDYQQGFGHTELYSVGEDGEGRPPATS